MNIPNEAILALITTLAGVITFFWKKDQSTMKNSINECNERHENAEKRIDELEKKINAPCKLQECPKRLI